MFFIVSYLPRNRAAIGQAGATKLLQIEKLLVGEVECLIFS